MTIERKEYLETLNALKDKGIIKVVTGIRRCGKSTILLMFMDHLRQNGVKDEQIVFYSENRPGDDKYGKINRRYHLS